MYDRDFFKLLKVLEYLINNGRHSEDAGEEEGESAEKAEEGEQGGNALEDRGNEGDEVAGDREQNEVDLAKGGEEGGDSDADQSEERDAPQRVQAFNQRSEAYRRTVTEEHARYEEEQGKEETTDEEEHSEQRLQEVNQRIENYNEGTNETEGDKGGEVEDAVDSSGAPQESSDGFPMEGGDVMLESEAETEDLPALDDTQEP